MSDHKVISTLNGVDTIEVEFKDQGKETTAQFHLPSSPMDFQKFISSLRDVENFTKQTEGSPYTVKTLADAFYEYSYALETHAKQFNREQGAALSTVITRDGRKIDLMQINVAKAILVVNAGYAMSAATESAVPTALANTYSKLLAEKKVVTQGQKVTWEYTEDEEKKKAEFTPLAVAA